MREHLCPQQETEEEYITQKDRNVLFNSIILFFKSSTRNQTHWARLYRKKNKNKNKNIQLPSFPVS